LKFIGIASHELKTAAAALTEPILAYLAALSLGREYEFQGDRSAAREQYEAAIRLYPTAQTPGLALDHLMRGMEDLEMNNSAGRYP
jgi:hypothetical protein